MATATGRMLRKPRVKSMSVGSGVRFRVDDDANHEFWLELWCSVKELRELLAEIDRGDGGEHWERVNENQCPD